MTLARSCRTVAVLVAILGAIDPSIMVARSNRPIVSLIDASSPTTRLDGTDRTTLTDRVARQLSRTADVARGLTAGASAVVVTGDRLPLFADSVVEPSFVILPPGPAAEAVEIDELAGPTRAHVDTRVPFIAVTRVMGGRGGRLVVTLSAGGATLDRAERVVAEDDARFEVPLTFVPTSIGTARIHVAAALSRSGSAAASPAVTAAADTLTRVDRRPWSVFVFDRRPSWMSTFVRRALEDDERFAVTSRTVTSRGVATDTPNAPADLHDVAALSRFDAIVVGAPDAVTTDDVSGLDAFLRRRGGAVICLWDVRPTGPALAMMGVDRWSADTRATDSAVTLRGGAIRASDLAWPARLPAQGSVIGPLDETGPTTTIGSPGSAAPDRPAIVWSAPVGSGQLVVSGALDSWRYRGAPHATFDAAWRQLIASAAEGSPAPIDVSVTPSVARPGQSMAIEVRLRDADAAMAAGGATTTMALRLEGPNGASGAATIRVWPGLSPGRFVATSTAPADAGWYRLVASDGQVSGDMDLLIDAGASSPRASERDALEAWATSRGGRVVDATALGELDSAIQRLAPVGSTREPYHPMRSAWWIGPVTLLLSIDWLRRRRRGLS